jgi:lysophospholipid acyltransferase (LPLAT)-like uncharacterized protein
VSDAKERRIRWIVRLGAPLLRLMAMTWRYEERGAEGWRALRAAKKPFIFSLWHGHLLSLTWRRRGEGITVMISEHSDGEIIARIVEGWGYRTVRGSTSRGAGRALLGMVRELESGREFAITPDGPRGPAGVAAAGVLLASNRSGAAIVPMRGDFSNAWQQGNWDRFAIPKPFSKIVITYGEPWVAPATDEAAAAELARRIGPAIPEGLPPRKPKAPK